MCPLNTPIQCRMRTADLQKVGLHVIVSTVGRAPSPRRQLHFNHFYELPVATCFCAVVGSNAIGFFSNVGKRMN